LNARHSENVAYAQVMRTILAVLLLHAALGDQCQAPTPQCIRGSTSDTLKKFAASDPESASTGACCSACLAKKGCVGSQLVSRAGDPPSCWLMATQAYGHPPAGQVCNSSLVAPTPPPARFNRTGYAGVWLQHGDWTDPAMYNASFLVGCDLPIFWSDIEVADGVFNFSSTDEQFAAAAAAGLYIETALSMGSGEGGSMDKANGVPDWIYKRSGGASVPRVAVVSSNGKGTEFFPYYLDPNYAPLFLRAVQAFAAHIASLPPAVRSRIVASQAMFGSTGDDTPWHGAPVDPKYNITTDQWQNFTGYNTTTGLATVLCGVFKAIQLPVLWNPGDNCANCIDTMAAACPGCVRVLVTARRGPPPPDHSHAPPAAQEFFQVGLGVTRGFPQLRGGRPRAHPRPHLPHGGHALPRRGLAV
jgi:hypothetical protein